MVGDRPCGRVDDTFDVWLCEVLGGAYARPGADERSAHDLCVRAQLMCAELAARAGDRDADGAGPGVQHALDRSCRPLIE